MAVTATAMRYIKLGRNGSWERAALDGGELHFGLRDAPHNLMLTGSFRGNPGSIPLTRGRGAATATREAREAVDFYRLDESCLWITFAREEHLWWTFAAPEVTWVGGDGSKHGERYAESHRPVAQYGHKRSIAQNQRPEHATNQGCWLSTHYLQCRG